MANFKIEPLCVSKARWRLDLAATALLEPGPITQFRRRGRLSPLSENLAVRRGRRCSELSHRSRPVLSDARSRFSQTRSSLPMPKVRFAPGTAVRSRFLALRNRKRSVNPSTSSFPKNLRKRHWGGYIETMRTGKTRYGTGDFLRCRRCERMGRVYRSSSRSSSSATRPAAWSESQQSCAMSAGDLTK